MKYTSKNKTSKKFFYFFYKKITFVLNKILEEIFCTKSFFGLQDWDLIRAFEINRHKPPFIIFTFKLESI